MAYTAQTWTNGVSKLNATRMTVMETGISDIHNLVTAKGDVYTATGSGAPAKLAVGANNTIFVADSAQTTGNKWAQLTNAMVDAAAAIAYSKLNLASSIVNADISASAAIDLTKLASAAFTTYTPTWGADAGVAPAIGNGTIAGRYIRIGKLVLGQILITMGGTTTYGSGGAYYTFTLPSTPQATYDPFSLALGTDTGVASYSGFCLSAGTNKLRVLNSTITTNWYTTYPFTFGSGDLIKINFAYEES